jgi:hypothetical protein
MDVSLQLPKFILIGRDALSHRPDRVLEAMKLQEIAGAFATCDLDAKLAEGLFSPILGVKSAPFVIMADFPFDLAAITDDGEYVSLELPEVTDVAEHENNPAGN